MPTAYLHIGMHKTGTSAFQQWCHANPDLLRAAGLAYPRLPDANHSTFLEVQYLRNEAVRRNAAESRGQGILLAEREPMRRAFERELSGIAAEGLDVVISGENATHFSVEEAADLRDTMRAHFDRVIAIALIRPPFSFVRSIAQAAVKGGYTFDEIAALDLRAKYRMRFEPWFKVMGEDGVRLGLYRPDRLTTGCVLEALLPLIDGDRSPIRPGLTPKVNEGLSATAVKFVERLSASLIRRELAPEFAEPLRSRLMQGLGGQFIAAVFRGDLPRLPLPFPFARDVFRIPGPAFVLPKELADPVQGKSEEDDAWMSERLGVDIRDYAETKGEAQALAEFRRFDEEEVERIVACLDRLDSTVQVPLETVMAGVAKHVRRQANDYIQAFDSPSRPAVPAS